MSLVVGDAPVTQAVFASLVGVTQPAISSLLDRGILSRDGSAETWLKEYCDNLRAQAGGRRPDLRLYEEEVIGAQRDNELKRIKIETAEKLLSPNGVMAEVLARTAAKISAVYSGLVPELKRRYPQLDDAVLDQIEREVVRAQNLVWAMSINDVLDDPDAVAEVAAEVEPVEAVAPL